MRRFPMQGLSGRRIFRHAPWTLLLSMAVPVLPGCGAEPLDTEAVEAGESPIIGGLGLAISAQRNLGLVNVGNGCSGALVSPTMVLTATHCVDLATPSNNFFTIPHPDGVLDTRVGNGVSRVGTTDMTLVSLSVPNQVQQWPTNTRVVDRTAPTSMLNNLSTVCYGRGTSAYATPSGVTGFGSWRMLNSVFKEWTGAGFRILAVNGREILAPGDSGGPCMLGGKLVAVTSYSSNFACANPTDEISTCGATLTKINDTVVAGAQPFADYIDNAPKRNNATFVPLTLEPGWTNAPFLTNNAGYASFDNVTHLRGAIKTTNGPSASVAFVLPPNARPSTDVYVPVNLCTAAKGRLVIKSDGTTRVEAAGGDWPSVQCFVSLEGVSFLTFTGFDSKPPLQNGWVGGVFGRAPAARINSGVVRLAGSLSGGTTNYAFTLAPSFRPATRIYLPVDMCNATKGRLQIEPNGDTSVYSEGPFSDAQCFTSLDGASFVAASNGNLTPLNGWVGAPFSTRAPGATNVGGIVRFQGALNTSGTNTQALQLAPADRPATMAYASVDLCGAAKGRLIIYPDGRVVVQSAGTWNKAQCFTSLEGAWFGI